MAPVSLGFPHFTKGLRRASLLFSFFIFLGFDTHRLRYQRIQVFSSCTVCEPSLTLFSWFCLLETIPSLPWLILCQSLSWGVFGLPHFAVLTVDWLYLLQVGRGAHLQGMFMVLKSVLAGDVVLLPLLGFNYWFMYLSILDDQYSIFN